MLWSVSCAISSAFSMHYVRKAGGDAADVCDGGFFNSSANLKKEVWDGSLGMTEKLCWLAIGLAALSIIYSVVLSRWIKGQPQGDDTMKRLSKAVQDGAMAFLKTDTRFFPSLRWSLLASFSSSTRLARPLPPLSLVLSRVQLRVGLACGWRRKPPFAQRRRPRAPFPPASPWRFVPAR